jgi:hypothetical protein
VLKFYALADEIIKDGTKYVETNKNRNYRSEIFYTLLQEINESDVKTPSRLASFI